MIAAKSIPAVFLDRDDTLIQNSGYLSDPRNVRLIPGATAALSRLRAAGFRVVIVTNQSGVARGLFTEEQLAAVNCRMLELLSAEGGAVDRVYYCPYLDGDEAVVAEYRRDSELRKPRPGMLLQAAADLGLDLSASWMIGDAERDVQAGRAAGCRTIRISLPLGEQTEALHVASNLSAAVDTILRNTNHAVAVQSTDSPSAAPPPPTHPLVTPPIDIAPLTAKLNEILDELRGARREAARQDFSAAKLAGAVLQAFAVCMLGWGLYAAIDSGLNQDAWGDAVVRLLAAIGFQLIALTCFASTRK